MIGMSFPVPRLSPHPPQAHPDPWARSRPVLRPRRIRATFVGTGPLPRAGTGAPKGV